MFISKLVQKMSSILLFRVVDGQEGLDKYYRQKGNAREYKKKRRAEIHQRYCVEKVTPDKDGRDCLCVISDGKETCAAHCYVMNLTEHELKECPLREEVWIIPVQPED